MNTSLPQDKDLEVHDPIDVETPDERLKRLEREAEINKIPPQPEAHVGPETTGVGANTNLQAVNQGNSLPATALPVDKTLADSSKFYDPHATELAQVNRDKALRGGQKTGE